MILALKNADDMLREVLQVVDTNRDGRIDYTGKIATLDFQSNPFRLFPLLGWLEKPNVQYPLNNCPEFHAFVNYAEDKLWPLFRYVDRHETGKIDKDSLREAFARAGVTVSDARVEEFFDDVDKNQDGVITYAEWRYD